MGSPAFGRKAMAGIRSALSFTSRPLRFHLVVDALGERDVKGALEDLEPDLLAKGVGLGDGRSLSQVAIASTHRKSCMRPGSRSGRWCHPTACTSRATTAPQAGLFASNGDVKGWLRMFPHLIVPESEVEDTLIWVDAGPLTPRHEAFLEETSSSWTIPSSWRSSGKTLTRTTCWRSRTAKCWRCQLA